MGDGDDDVKVVFERGSKGVLTQPAGPYFQLPFSIGKFWVRFKALFERLSVFAHILLPLDSPVGIGEGGSDVAGGVVGKEIRTCETDPEVNAHLFGLLVNNKS